MSQAHFYDIATLVNHEDEKIGLQEQINAYVVRQRLNIGDVLFVGTEYGFYIVLSDQKAQHFENVGCSTSDHDVRTILQQAGVRFNTLFKEMTDNNEFKFLFFPDDDDETTDMMVNCRTYGLL